VLLPGLGEVATLLFAFKQKANDGVDGGVILPFIIGYSMLDIGYFLVLSLSCLRPNKKKAAIFIAAFLLFLLYQKLFVFSCIIIIIGSFIYIIISSFLYVSFNKLWSFFSFSNIFCTFCRGFTFNWSFFQLRFRCKC